MENKIKSREEVLARNERIRQEQMAKEAKLEAVKKVKIKVLIATAAVGIIVLVVGIILLNQPKELGGLDWQFAMIVAGLVVFLISTFMLSGLMKKPEDDSVN